MKDLKEITSRFANEVGEWVEEVGGPLLELQEVEEKLNALRSSLGAKAATEVSRALSVSKKTLREIRMREAAEAISIALREVGIRVDPGTPMKRKRRTPKTTPATSPPTPAEPSFRDDAEKTSEWGTAQ